MSRRPLIRLFAALGVVACACPAAARQAEQPTAVSGGARQARPAAVQPAPRPAQAPAEAPPTPRRQAPKASRDDEGRPLGFSVVLVAGDLRATAGGEDDVPPAARRALADMKDFLPYKSYRLLDAAWVLCCGPGHTTTRLRGPDDKEYELEIVAVNGPITRQSIRFVLRHAGGSTADELAEARAELQDLERQLEAETAAATAEARAGSGSGRTSAYPVERREALVEQRRRVEQARVRVARAAGGTVTGDRPIIDTSFAMDVGETVVVGTSRLSGGDRALIALLTAVPQRPSQMP